jgi:nicotinic acid mononucleotide adenylyltransferase
MNGEARTAAIEERVSKELSSMQEMLGNHADGDAFLALEQWTLSTLGRIGDLITNGHMDPAGRGKRRSGAPRKSPSKGSFRLGVFPTAGNPLHWGHLSAGLAAIERFHLDKVVYVIAGEDPRKPTLAPEHIRHRIASEVLGLFHPLLEYSPLSLGSTKPGEVNAFRFFAANKELPLHMFYLVGSDHFHRFTPREGRPDTIQRLETGIRRRSGGFNPRRHKLSVVFLDRGDECEPVESFLDVRWVDHLPVKASSTRIRDALSGQMPLCELVALPFSAYCMICAQGTYRMHRQTSECDFDRTAGGTEDLRAASTQEAGAYASSGGMI